MATVEVTKEDSEEIKETLKGLEEALGKALQPIKDDLQTVKDDLKHVRMRVNQMYDALEERGLQHPELLVRQHDDLALRQVCHRGL